MPLAIIGRTFTAVWDEREAVRLHHRVRQRLLQRGLDAELVLAELRANDIDGQEGLSQKELIRFCALVLPNELSVATIRLLWESLDKEHTGQISYETFINATFPEVATSSSSDLINDSFADRVGSKANGRVAPGQMLAANSQGEAMLQQLDSIRATIALGVQSQEALQAKVGRLECGIEDLREQVTRATALLTSLAAASVANGAAHESPRAAGGVGVGSTPTRSRQKPRRLHSKHKLAEAPSGRALERYESDSFKEVFRSELATLDAGSLHSKDSPPPQVEARAGYKSTGVLGAGGTPPAKVHL